MPPSGFFLNGNKIIKVGETKIPYPLFVMFGTMLWQVFAEGVNQPLINVRRNIGMLIKINFPREALLLSALYTITFNLGPKLLVLFIASCFYSIDPSVGLLYFPIGVLMLSFTGFSIGQLLTPVGLLLQDVSRGIAILLPFLMYLTPVIYPVPTSGKFAQIMKINPLALLINSARDWATGQLTHIPNGFIFLSGLIILMFIVGMVIYRLSMPIITERFGG